MISDFAKDGKRVLLLATHDSLDEEGSAIALMAISDNIRPGAKETIENFQEQGVTLKVISGDHAETVSTIAGRVGIANSEKYISCESISDEELINAADEYTVFGRVTPEQKVLLIKTLRINGHTVAMTGDGVNDTLALKESNCAIAMADGSEMARKVSHIVLMNSDFSTLPDVVREGRRCINNVRQSSTLYLMKTIFTIFLSIVSVITLAGYPFEPKQFLPLELFIIGIASVLLALEPNNKRIEGSYMKTVIIKSVPNAISMLVPVFALMIIEKFMPMTIDCRNSIAMIIVTVVAYINLIALCKPFTKWRTSVVAAIGVLIGATVPVTYFLLSDMLHFKATAQNLPLFFIMLASSIVLTILMQMFRGKIEKIIEKKILENEGKEWIPISKKIAKKLEKTEHTD
jgi:cation-transporting ATPase E